MPTIPPALRRPVEMPLNEKLLWSLADAERATSLSRRTLQNYIRAGRLPAVKIGRRVLLDPIEVKKALLASANRAIAP